MVNSLVVMLPIGTRPISASPALGGTEVPEKIGDELDAAEIAALAKAINTQCQTSPTMRRYIERLLAVGSGGQLVTVVGIIATRRMARHGLLPAMLDPLLGIQLATGNIGDMTNLPPTPLNVDETTHETEPNRTPEMDEPIDFETIG
jgi:hypothetical protein